MIHGLEKDWAKASYDVNEWDGSLGRDSWVFTNERHELTMQLKVGRTITGVVVDPEGKALPGMEVRTFHDLHVLSHTGSGGEIFKLRATTDAEGRFRIEHIYPVSCAIRAAGGEESTWAWVRTRSTVTTPKASSTRWQNRAWEKIPEMIGMSGLDLMIVMARHAPTYHYFGKVTDASGHPMGGLHIWAGVSRHAKPEDYGDEHYFEFADTDAQGNWVLEASSPYVRFFSVRPNAKSYESLGGADYENDEVGLAEPGEYNFQVNAVRTLSK